jgi:Sulfotransferase family
VTIDRPIFIIGPHRSGTTLVYETLARHPDVGFFNRYNKKMPAWPRAAHLLTRLLGADGDKPLESQPVWDRFRTGDSDLLTAEDATPEVIAWHRALVERVLGLRGRTRFLAKYPRLSLRLPWLDTIFPDAIFLHVTRDWRAVVNSTLNRKAKRTDRGGGWFGVRIPGWRDMGDVPHEEAAARQFRAVTQTLEDAAPAYGSRFLLLSYEEFCADPIGVLKGVTATCGLAWADEFEASIPTNLRSANFKWREQIGEETIARLRATDEAFFQRYELA